MKKTIAVVMCAIVASSLQAAPILVAGWDNFTGTDAWVPNYKDADTTVSVSATTAVSGRNWAQWNYQDQGASGDGTFGNLSTSIAGADTGWADNDDNLSLNSADGTIVFTLTNDSTEDRTMDGFYFDSIHKNSKSADTWALTFSGAISGTAAGGSIAQEAWMFNNSVNPGTETPAANRDHAVDLSGLTDKVWEAGQDIVLTLAFTGSDNTAGTNGGNELALDNIAVTVIPEPATLGLIALFGGGIVFIRRRFMI